MELRNKYALVTGSAKGIGKDIVLALADKGCNVIIHYFKSKSEALKLKKEIGKKVKVFCFSSDLRKEKNVKKLFYDIDIKIGQLDILINNVGNYIRKDLNKLTIPEWHEMLDSNLNSTFYCTFYGLPLLRKRKTSRIINIGYATVGNLIAKPTILPYFIAKNGVYLLTKAYAKEELKNNVLINMLSPGIMENSVEFRDDIKKIGSTKKFSKLIIDIIKDDYITGSNIDYSGGLGL